MTSAERQSRQSSASPQKPVRRGQLLALHQALQYRELMPETEHFNFES